MWKCEGDASKNNGQSKLSIEEEKKILMLLFETKNFNVSSLTETCFTKHGICS